MGDPEDFDGEWAHTRRTEDADELVVANPADLEDYETNGLDLLETFGTETGSLKTALANYRNNALFALPDLGDC